MCKTEKGEFLLWGEKGDTEWYIYIYIYMYSVLKFSETEVWIKIYIENEWGHFVMSFLCGTAIMILKN